MVNGLTSGILGAATGAVNAAITGTDVLQGALMGLFQGAISGGILHGLGEITGMTRNILDNLIHIAGHGALGGAVNVMMGEKFGDGFLSGAFGAFSSYIPGGNGSFWTRTLKASILGGTGSVLGGGKFANGAYTAAFQHLFNEEGGRKLGVGVTDVKYEIVDGAQKLGESGHAFMYLKDEKGVIVGIYSFGPAEIMNSGWMQATGVDGTPLYLLHADNVKVREYLINETQFSTLSKGFSTAATQFKEGKFNLKFVPMFRNCSTEVVRVLRLVDIKLPNGGSGPIIYGQFRPPSKASPYHILQGLGKTSTMPSKQFNSYMQKIMK